MQIPPGIDHICNVPVIKKILGIKYKKLKWLFVNDGPFYKDFYFIYFQCFNTKQIVDLTKNTTPIPQVALNCSVYNSTFTFLIIFIYLFSNKTSIFIYERVHILNSTSILYFSLLTL